MVLSQKGRIMKVLGGKTSENIPDDTADDSEYAKIIVKIYKADCIPRMDSGIMAQMKIVNAENAELRDPYVQVSLWGSKGSTAKEKCTMTPCWDEQIVFMMKFPFTPDTIFVQVRDGEIMVDKVVGSTAISMDEISNKSTGGFLPTFGPCYVYLRESKNTVTNEDDTSFRGRILMAVSTEIVTNPDEIKPVDVQPTIPLPKDICGFEKEFLLFACLWDVTMIDKKIAGNKGIRFTLQIGHIPEYSPNSKQCFAKKVLQGVADAFMSNMKDGMDNQESVQMYGDAEYCSPFMTPSATDGRERYYHLPIYETKPCLSLTSSWPDCRWRMYISNIKKQIVEKMDLCLNSLCEHADARNTTEEMEVRKSLEVLENATLYFLKLLKLNWKWNGEIFSYKTQLDEERWKMYLTCIAQVIEVTTTYRMTLDRANIKVAIGKLELLLQDLKSMEKDPQPTLPDVVVWMENYYQKRIGYYKFAACDLLHYATSEAERGEHCGKIRSFFFKAVSEKKGKAVIAKVDVYLWLGLLKQLEYCLKGLPQGFVEDFGGQEVPRVLKYSERQVYQLEAHIYQARSLPWHDKSKFPSPVAQLSIGKRCLYTQLCVNTLNPIWDVTILLNGLVFCGTKDEICRYSPNIVIEIRDSILIKSLCLSRGVIPLLEEDSDLENLPLFKWYNMMSSTESEEPAQILAAFKLIPMPEAEGDTQMGSLDYQYCTTIPVLKLPATVRPRFTPHRIEILLWGLRELKRTMLTRIKEPQLELECAGNVVQSSVIKNYKNNSNFINMIEVIDMDLPEDEAHFPVMSIRLKDNKSFGRRNFIASHVVQYLRKYAVKANGEVLEPKFHVSATEIRNREVNYVAIGLESLEQIPRDDSVFLQKVYIPWTYSKAVPSINTEEDEEDWWFRYYISTEYKPQQTESISVRPTVAIPGDYQHTALDISEARLSMIPDRRFETQVNMFHGMSSSDSLDARAFTVYSCELENVAEFGGFEDRLHSFELTRGRKFTRMHDAEKTVAVFKGCFRIYATPLPRVVADPFLPVSNTLKGLFYGLPENKPTKLRVRAYIVKATDLTPSDMTCTADPYIAIQLGKQKISNKESYISKQLNPEFGQCFELVANFPSDSTMVIRVMDWDLVGRDDLIGETKIDLENRFYSRHRATCGLARTYETCGPNAWRDVHTPLEILTQQCQASGLGKPHVTKNEISIANIIYDFSENMQDGKASEQDGALFLLHRWEDISPGKYPLVPEHLEERTLHHPSKPGEPQGKLIMWLDMYPENTVPPSSRDISVRKPKGYELRVIIWNTDEVILADDAFFTGEKMSDIYVKGWLTGKDVQRTDVHYRSLTGEGNFNWRFVFPFDYLPIERKMVMTKKVSIFSWDETEFKMPPHLKLQVWDADHFKADDYLGELTLDLDQFPRGAKSVSQCSLEMLRNDDTIPKVALFKQKRTRGWWPVFAENKNGQKELTGKVEVELHLLTAEEAKNFPVGLGRKEPDPLQKPKRPNTSFVNFLSPLKTFRYAVWRHYRKKTSMVIIFIAVLLVFLLFFYSAPGYMAKKLIGA